MKRFQTFVVVAVALSLAAKPAADLFQKKLSKDDQIRQALSRLTFGERPGDFEAARKIGLKKWIDQQLHPEKIAEDSALMAKLGKLDSLTMSNAEIVKHYPPPQLIRGMAKDRIALPDNPAQRAMVEKYIERYKAKLAGTQTDAEKMKEESDDKIAKQRFARASVEDRRNMLTMRAPQQVLAHDLTEGKMLRAVYSNRQLEEVLADFWFNHFNVYLDKGANRMLVTAYERDAIRPHVLGSFKDMLVATAKSPAMLFYLDNWQSVAPEEAKRRGGVLTKRFRGLNENYGRELLELHTLGVDGGYTQKDVTEAARAFTGWSIGRPYAGAEFQYNDRVHDKGEKTVLGVKIPAGGGMEDGMKVLDIVAAHPSVANYISRKLAVRFVADNPPEQLVRKMAATFTKTDGDLRAVLKTMFDSTEFISQGAYRAKLKSPLEMVASAVRATGATVENGFNLGQAVANMGQPLYRKVEPTGYSNSSEEWLNSSALLNRMNFAVALTANKVPGVKVELTEDARLVAQRLGSPEFQKR